jgi:hypothetical protein
MPVPDEFVVFSVASKLLLATFDPIDPEFALPVPETPGDAEDPIAQGVELIVDLLSVSFVDAPDDPTLLPVPLRVPAVPLPLLAAPAEEPPEPPPAPPAPPPPCANAAPARARNVAVAIATVRLLAMLETPFCKAHAGHAGPTLRILKGSLARQNKTRRPEATGFARVHPRRTCTCRR